MSNPSPEGSVLGPQFVMNDREAYELGLTIHEQMRHRWTDEFPERIDALTRRIFIDQTSKPFFVAGELSSRSSVSEQQPTHQFTKLEDILTQFPDYEAFKHWRVRNSQ
jgi:hypothetical protein